MGGDHWVSEESLVQGVMQQYLAMNPETAAATSVTEDATSSSAKSTGMSFRTAGKHKKKYNPKGTKSGHAKLFKAAVADWNRKHK